MRQRGLRNRCCDSKYSTISMKVNRHSSERSVVSAGLPWLWLTFCLLCPSFAKVAPVDEVRVLIVTGGHEFDEAGFLGMFRKMEGIVFTQAAYGKGNFLHLAEHSKKTGFVKFMPAGTIR